MKTTEDLLKTVGEGIIVTTSAIEAIKADNAYLRSEVEKLKKTVKEINIDNEISPDMKDYIEDRKKNAERRKQ